MDSNFALSHHARLWPCDLIISLDNLLWEPWTEWNKQNGKVMSGHTVSYPGVMAAQLQYFRDSTTVMSYSLCVKERSRELQIHTGVLLYT